MINHVYLRMIKLSHELIYKYDYFRDFYKKLFLNLRFIFR